MAMTGRDAELLRAQARGYRSANNLMRGADEEGATNATRSLLRTPTDRSEVADGKRAVAHVGTLMSGLLRHGGLYTLADSAMMESRFSGMMAGLAAACPPEQAHCDQTADLQAAMVAARSLPAFFFYHLVDNPYPLHSQLVSYLTHLARHLRSPVDTSQPYVPNSPPPPPKASAPPYGPVGKTYDQFNRENTCRADVPAAATFIGQFIDHDLTLNAMNLLDPQAGPDVRDGASPLIDLDNVYGPRLDDHSIDKTRVVPMHKGMFRLRKIDDSSGYDVCRQFDPCTCTHNALIGDKRNDENQLILQVHILAMRLHNHFMRQLNDFDSAKYQTILHWQLMVATYYLPLIAQPRAINAVKNRLFHNIDHPDNPERLCHRPGLTLCGGCTLGMPHEFAIGFRFGHSQLRSEYCLRADANPIRLFDPIFAGVPPHDLQGGKPLAANHLIDWNYFTDPTRAPSNLIDTKVTEDVFALPESTVPDDIKLVNNLPLRNLIRSNSLGLCAGEDLAHCYGGCYEKLLTGNIVPQDAIEPPGDFETLFKLAPEKNCDAGENPFRTPLWFYILAEAEWFHKHKDPAHHGRLGMVGSLLIAEVVLSGVRYATITPSEGKRTRDICRSHQTHEGRPCSIFEDAEASRQFRSWNAGDDALMTFVQLADMVEASNVIPPGCPPE